MPLHRNKSSLRKTMAFKNEDAFVKENHSLSRERVSVFTQVSSTKDISLKPEFVLKEQGTRTKIDATNVNYPWSPSGLYRSEHMLKITKNLPNHFNPFTQKGFAIYVIDDYAVHLMPEIRKALYERGCILILMGGGITGFIQANDTDLHKRLKALYREEEINLMLKMLVADKSKIPYPSRDNMIKMLMSSWDAITTDAISQIFKKLFVTNKLDGSEDYLVSDKLFSLIGNEMKDFRDSLLKSDVPNNLKTIVKQLIPPKWYQEKF